VVLRKVRATALEGTTLKKDILKRGQLLPGNRTAFRSNRRSLNKIYISTGRWKHAAVLIREIVEVDSDFLYQ